MAAYPQQLLSLIQQRCASRREHGVGPPFPGDSVLSQLLDTAFHASLLSEEGRRLGFRIILLPRQQDIQGRQGMFFANRFRKIIFQRPRPYTVAEINRLAPVAELTRLLICVDLVDDEEHNTVIEIWGLLDVGEKWWRFVHHEASGGRPPPNALTIASLNPGEIVISAQGEVIVALRAGAVCLPQTTALWSGPVSDFLAPARQQLHDDVITRLGVAAWDSDGEDEDYPQRLYIFFLERILFNIRKRRHGGTLIVVPPKLSRLDTRITDRLLIKYHCEYDCAWETLLASLVNHRRFYDLHFPLWHGSKKITQAAFQEHCMMSSEAEEIDEALSDQAEAIACLSSVDGAVVITDRFTVLGFGAEVTAASPTLTSVMQHTASGLLNPTPIESYGTRHRSAFRLCSSLEEVVAFVVSQDGGVRAIKRVGSDVVLWPDINSGAMGI